MNRFSAKKNRKLIYVQALVKGYIIISAHITYVS